MAPTDRALVPAPPLALRPTFVTRIALAPVLGIPIAIAVAAASPVAVVAFAASYVASWAVIARRRLIVDDDGVEIRGVFGRRRVRWDDIDYYTYWSALARASWKTGQITSQRMLDSPAARVSVVQHHLALYTTIGRRLVVNSFFTGAEHAVARILDVVHALHATRAEDFAPYALVEDGLVMIDRDALPWSQLEKVVLSGSVPPEVRIMKDRKVFPWSRISLGKIRNGMRFLEKLAARGVEIDIGERAFVTRALAEQLGRAERLPRAQLRRRPRPKK